MKDAVSEPDCRKCGKCCAMLGCPPFLQQLEEQGIQDVNECPLDYLDMPEDIPARLRWEYQGYVAAVHLGRAMDRSGETLKQAIAEPVPIRDIRRQGRGLLTTEGDK